MTEYGWRFIEVRPEAVSQDPTQREFFAPEEGVAGALVREAIQNSLDARPPNATAPVLVRFHFGADQNHPFGSSPYFDILREHLATEFPTLPEAHAPVSFLVIEDFGTRGLQGDPANTIYQEHESIGQARNDFFYFWRNVGRSRKEATDRGRWGLGKTVFPASSKISSFFGYTIRISDSRRLLMGQSVLKVHSLESGTGNPTIFEPYGFFGRYEGGSNFPLPIEDSNILLEFSNRFSVSRNDEGGLSIVIPFPLEELTPRAIAQEVVRSYYASILEGELQVIASDSHETYDITRESIVPLTLSLPWEGMRVKAGEMAELVRFADRALQLGEDELLRIADQHPTRAPESLKDRVPEESTSKLREQFENGELVAVRVPVLVKMESGTITSHFDAFIQRDPSLSSGTADFIREGLAITQTGKTPRHPVRGLILVRDKPLSTLLGDAENPAHTKWQELAVKVKEPKYVHGSRTVRLVNAALQQLTEYLAFRPEERDVNLLADIFYLPQEDPEHAGKGDGLKERDGGVIPPPVIPPPSTPKAVLLSQIAGGFRLSANPQGSEMPEQILVEVAYAVRVGNPFKRYRPFDFDLKNLDFRGKGIKIVHAAENRMSVAILDTDFGIQVTGFDENRDLDVKISSQMRENTP